MKCQDITALLDECNDLIEHQERLLRHRSHILEEQILLLEQRKGLLLLMHGYGEAVKRFLDRGFRASTE